VIPQILIKPIIYVFAFISFGSVCFYKGCTYSESKYIESGIKQSEKNAQIVSKAVKDTEEKTRLLYENQIKQLKKRAPLPDTCILSADFRRMHDNATGVPESTATQTVTVDAVANTVETNYLNCRQNQIWLEECNDICR